MGITLDTAALDLDFLEPLHRPEFDVDALLELDDSQYVAETLAKLQTDRGVQELSRRALTAESSEEITEINRQLSPHLLQTIVSDKKAAEEKSNQSLRRIRELEAKLSEIESRTIWQRLKALFGLKK